MLISMNWIRDFVDLSDCDIKGLIRRFTLSTAEVEDIIHKGADTKKVIVARIVSVQEHPKSKKLHLLKVDIGTQILDCVCGAPNVREGMRVAFACDGGMVNGVSITTSMVGGYESQGMCCSEQELGISADNSGIMEITDDIPLGVDIKDVYNIDDIVFEVDNKSLTNRPDLWGHYGVAREFAALVDRPLKPVRQFDDMLCGTLPKVEIDVVDKELTYRYTSVKVENIKVKTSPVNMRVRLFYCGLRSINLLADLTNYVMLELGQPMHAFDSSKVNKIEVKRFDTPFEFETLDNNKRNIDEQTLMICSNEKPVAIAGIMGGLNSEITKDTSSILLESANFDGVSIRKSSTRLGLRTDASVRYEKIFDPELTLIAINRYLKLLMDIDKDIKITSCVTDVFIKGFPEVVLSFDKAFVDRYTGIDISCEKISKTLKALGFTVDYKENMFKVEVPSWRRTKDVTIKADIIEEITRIYGYDNFEIKGTYSLLAPVQNTLNRTDEFNIKNLLVDKYSFHEVHSYIWCDARKFKEIGIEVENNVKVVNSLSTDLTVIRNSMIPTLLTILNDNKYFSSKVGIFEIGRVVDGIKENGYCNERKKIGFAILNKEDSEENAFYAMKNLLSFMGEVTKNTKFTFKSIQDVQHSWQHPINTANVLFHGEVIGFISVIHPSVQMKIDKKATILCAELDMDLFSSHEPTKIQFNEPSKYQNIEFDLSFLIKKDASFSTITEIVDSYPCDYLIDYRLLSIYTDESLKDMKSVTIRMNFCSNERTLSMEEVQQTVNKYISLFEEKDIHLKI